MAKRGASRPPARLQNRACEFPRTRLLGGRSVVKEACAGLGRLISQSADAFNMPELFAGVVVLAVAGIAMTAGFTLLERKLVPWTRD